MGEIAESLTAYAQPLTDKTDGSSAEMQKAFMIAQMCWNIALLPEAKQESNLAQMRSDLNMTPAEFADFRESLVAPMIKRHRQMFPNMHQQVAEGATPRTRKKKYSGIGRNDPCPCNSGKKYKKCCGP